MKSYCMAKFYTILGHFVSTVNSDSAQAHIGWGPRAAFTL